MGKLSLFIPLMTVIMAFTGSALGGVDCTMSTSEIFQQKSPSVVLITALSIDPFKISERFSSAIGSGFIINDKGLILTNSHVVFGATAIAVRLDNQETIQAELIGADPIMDIAVIRISVPRKGLPVSTLGDSDRLQIGEEVIAIGNPLGFEQTLTRGVVSGINRMIPVSPMGMMLPVIQTDAAINPGNSGGPLLNRCGEVIGINTAGIFGAENIGFAVPINIAKQIMPQLVTTGRVIRPWLGVRGKLIKKKELATLFTIPLVDGFLIEIVEPGSPAEKAGLQSGGLPIKIAGDEILLGGDIITTANGQTLDSDEKYLNFVRSLKIGDNVYLKVYREGKTIDIQLTIIERPILPWDLQPMGQSDFSSSLLSH